MNNAQHHDKPLRAKLPVSDAVRWTRKAGSDYGLRLTLHIDADNYVGLLAPEYAAQIVVHDHGVIPVPEEEGVGVKPGWYYNITTLNSSSLISTE